MLESAVFDGVPREKLAELSQAVEHIVVPPHTVVIRQGEPGDSFYLINAGKVKIIRVDEEGLETDFATMGRGESFGEMALLTGQPRSATVETLEETRLTVIPKGKFDQILKDYPQVSMKFINQLSSWLLRDDERLQEEKQLAAGRPGVSWVDFVIILA
ncbi:cyclic nucleotide-binding domain-containing protein, partial [bacterium]|nr:cyclic nucleotide-binding domain-containing protein [bacterium]